MGVLSIMQWNACSLVRHTDELKDYDTIFGPGNNRNTIITGDFNAHSPLWGQDNRDARGKSIEDQMQNNNYILLNDKEYTHMKYNGEGNILDLAIASSDIAHRCTSMVLNST